MTTYTYAQTIRYNDGRRIEHELEIVVDERKFETGGIVATYDDPFSGYEDGMYVAASFFTLDFGAEPLEMRINGDKVDGLDGETFAFDLTWDVNGAEKSGRILYFQPDGFGSGYQPEFAISISGDALPARSFTFDAFEETAAFEAAPRGSDAFDFADIPNAFDVTRDDSVTGGGGRDRYELGRGDDVAHGGGGGDRLFGERGNDRLFGESGSDRLFGGGGGDRLFGGSGGDHLDGGRGNDKLYGHAGNDDLIGAGGSDILDGGDGRDTLLGNAGSDRLHGGADADTLDGGRGNDVLTGGRGADRFVLSGGRDLVTDLRGNDVILAEMVERLTINGKGDVVLHGDGGRLVFDGVEDKDVVRSAIVDDFIL